MSTSESRERLQFRMTYISIWEFIQIYIYTICGEDILCTHVRMCTRIKICTYVHTVYVRISVCTHVLCVLG